MSKKYLVLSSIVAVIFLGAVTYASIVSNNESQLFSNADKNGDGVLDKNEFMNYIKLTQREKQKKSKRNSVRICPRTGEICEENCSGDGECCSEGAAKSGCCKENKGAAKSGCCKENKGAAKSGCCKENKGAAKSGCCKENKGAAKSGCCKENKGAAKSGCCKENKGAAKSGCCKENKGAAKSGCCKENKGAAKSGCCKENKSNNTTKSKDPASLEQVAPSTVIKSGNENTAPVK